MPKMSREAKEVIIYYAGIILVCLLVLVVSMAWAPTRGKYYGPEKEYFINCRLKKDWIPKEQVDMRDKDRKCEYVCTDGDKLIISPPRHYPCQYNVQDKRLKTK